MAVKRLFWTLLGGVMVSLLVMGLMFSGSKDVKATDFDVKNETLIDDLRTSDSEITIDGITKNYFEEDKRVKIVDDKDEVEIEMKLLTPYENKIGLNKPVAEWLLVDWNDRTETFDSITSYDKNTDYKTIEKVYTYKYKKITPTEVCYDVPVNNTDSRDSIIEKEVTKECYTYDKQEWISFNSLSDLPNKNIVIGAFTDTEYGDYVEFVPTIGDFEVKEWASYLVTDLVSYYKIDNSTGDAIDVVGSNDGTIYGATYTSSGKINGARDFDGDSDYIKLTSTYDFQSENAITYAAWIKPTALQDYDGIIGGWSMSTSAQRAYLGTMADGSLIAAMRYTDGDIIAPFSATGQITTGSWYHVAMTAEGGTGGSIKIYINGVQSGTTEDITKTLRTMAGSWYIGQTGNNGWFDGLIDEAGLWERVLNSTEISELYNSGDGLAYPFVTITNCKFSGYIKDEDGNALNGTKIIITNQYDQSEYYNSTSNSTGAWSIDVENSTNTYMVGAYYNNTLVGKLNPYISGSC